MRYPVGYSIFVLCLILGLLGWISHIRQRDFHEYHVVAARESASIAAEEIARFVQEKQRLVQLFARDNRALMQDYVSNLGDAVVYRQLAARVADYFPDHFTFALMDAEGRLLIDDFDGLIGELCLSDLHEFLETGRQRPRIHPHSEKYHFDVLAPLGADAAQGVFFISFHADILGRVLNAIQHPGHQLILVYPESGDLIEVTADGARINWMRDDYRIALEEKRRILHRQPMPGTRWEVIDLHIPQLFENYSRKLLGQSALIFTAFMLISLVMLFYLHRGERLRRSAEDTIRQMAFYDELTGLPNRRLLKERLRQAMAHSARSRCHGALMFMDLDNFKALNDIHGHDMGDLLLIEVANRIRSRLRAEDTVARFGGDEFVVLIGDLDPDRDAALDKVLCVGEKLLAALADPYQLSCRRDDGADTRVERRCTSSIGVVLFSGDVFREDDMLKWADMAMYRAKEAGRNQIRISEEIVVPA